ncbi:MAG: HD domain-containing protein [Candidatus Gottesmanbacteria bacterium]
MENIFDTTISDLETKKIFVLVPELKPLEHVIENNIGHKKQDVWMHTKNVFRALQEALRCDFLNTEKKAVYLKYFSTHIGTTIKAKAMMVAVIFHDIAKSHTLTQDAVGNTMCPNHEKIGAEMIKQIIKRLGLLKEEQLYICQLVLHHGTLHGLLGFPFKENLSVESLRKEKRTHHDIWSELVFLCCADILGADFVRINPDDANRRIKRLISWL